MCDAFNNQFLTDILRRYENDDSLKVEKFETKSACEPGGNFTCEVSRVLVTGTRNVRGSEEVYKTSIIVKRVPKDPKHAELYRSNIALQNEAHAYNTIIPALSKYAVDESLPVPKCIHAQEDLIILQDLELLGYHTIDKNEGGFTLNQCRAVLQALAKLHAASLVMIQKEPQALHSLTKLTKEPMFEGGDSKLLRSQKCYVDFALHAFNDMLSSPDNDKAVLLLTKLTSTVNVVVKELLTDPQAFSVIGHGDAWVGNVMFNKQGEAKLIDLQFMRYNSVAADLCYLFYVNLQPALWKEHTKTLLREYLNTLLKNIKKKEQNLDDVLTQDWLSHEMSRFSVYGLMRALWVMPMFFYKKEDVDLSNLTPEMLSDTDAMISKAGPGYVERMKELVLNYVKNK